MAEPKKGLPVRGRCIICHRDPRPGEKYGPRPGEWDFTNICPECWDEKIAVPEDIE